MNNIKNWNIIDNYPHLSLNEIQPFSERAQSLFSRNKANSKIQEGYLHINGAIFIMKGMDHHFNNYLQSKSKLNDYLQSLLKSSRIMTENERINKEILYHEITAYFNRLGQYYHFSKSKFVTSLNPKTETETVTPYIKRLMIFRNKHTSHRSIDYPRKKDTQHQREAHAISLMGGHLLIDKNNMIKFQIRNEEAECIEFTPEIEHDIIMNEAYLVLESIIN